ncbi:MAG TPA: Hsp20/alpha crystallin family protein [Gemmatimonadales bacterium]|jgi:HSP20 family protein|nr:Hsp20/alpha crystallin family protein [Gemmatimonadales bacterium]
MKLATMPTLGTVKRDMDELFGRFITPFAPLGYEPFTRTFEGYAFEPALDLVETEKEYVIRLEVPGIPKENLDVNLEGEILTVTGHKEKVAKDKGENYLWEEREAGKFMRAIRLPKPVEAAKIEAAAVEGVLTIHLPKKEVALKNKILIKA